MTGFDQQWLVDRSSANFSASREALAAAEHALVCLGKHLRFEHGLSRRRVAHALGQREKWVKENVEHR